ncbi:VOC family protein [Halomicroarcula sp. S1AR25-4]|uniref:VOC family protein n=1 Tax=Haloarcula sp. S1AR25-4 TaxID=2950538 RepID=UPI00287414D5|nr:VOC family protein [Halomicroarcula sp. S1AR25-4]MDS0276188.1 VOC family protein [Halomicroarcula sp. S1AR25-4]
MADKTDALPAETDIGRVALTVGDATETVEFYETVVGLFVHERQAARTVLGDGEMPLLELHEDSGAPERSRSAAGLFHTAFRVPSRAALGDALERIDTEWQLSGASDHLVSEALYCRDPEGNGVEIYRDRPREEWGETADGGVEMATKTLDRDGVRAVATGAKGVPEGTDVGHVHLEVTSLEAARAFYVDALGMNVRTTYDGALFLAAGDYHHHVGANVWNGRTDPASGRGLAWFELVFPNSRTVEAATDRLSTAGYEVTADGDGVSVTDGDDITLRLRS